MGKATRVKLEERQAIEDKFRNHFLHNNKALKERAARVIPHVGHQLQAYSTHFLRDPFDYTIKTKSKDQSKQLLEVVRHTFGKYKVGPVLTGVWTNNLRENGATIDFKKWYICVATGGSLYKDLAKEHLSRKETHIFLACPHNLPPQEAMTYAIAKAEGANEGVALRLSRSKLRMTNEFWKYVTRFFVHNTPETIDSTNDLVDFIQTRRNENATFSLAGYTLQSLKQRMHQWHADLRRMKVMGNITWVGFDMPDTVYTAKNENGDEYEWIFHQITNSKELAAEGNRMRHCVYSYKDRCVNGNLSIWSLKRNEYFNTTPKVTIELSNYGSINQARGLANRSVRSDEYKAITMWARQFNLTAKFYHSF